MLNIILKTVQEKTNLEKISLDGFKFDKSDFEIINKEQEIIKINKKYINLKAVKELEFLEKQANILEAL